MNLECANLEGDNFVRQKQFNLSSIVIGLADEPLLK